MGGRCLVWKVDSLSFQQNVSFAEEIQVTVAAGVRWIGGSMVADPAERAFVAAEHLFGEAVIPEAVVDRLKQEAYENEMHPSCSLRYKTKRPVSQLIVLRIISHLSFLPLIFISLGS